MNAIDIVQGGELVWFPRLGFGYVDPDKCPINYGADYFENYEGYDASPTSAPLVAARSALVERHHPAEGTGIVVDVGIGAGAFVRHRLERGLPVAGFDVMPRAICWLHHRDLFHDPMAAEDTYAATFWDSLEHMRQPERIIARVDRWAFVSMPIYTSAVGVLASKHFKPGEHIWYFTQRGLVEWFQRQGFVLREYSTCEMDCGREDIGAFAFERADR